MSKVYSIISDIHGMYEEFIQLLKHVDLGKEYLIINGDMTDRGKDSYKVIKKVMELQHTYQDKVIVIMGNHEEFLIDWVDTGFENAIRYITPTILSFYKTIDQSKITIPMHKHFKKTFKKEINWLRNLPYKYETKHMVVVHAGVDLDKGLENNDEIDFVNLRYWWDKENTTDKLIVFGHTPVRNIHNSNDIWYDKENKYLGIDGFASGGGQLNLVKVSKGKLIDKYSVQKIG